MSESHWSGEAKYRALLAVAEAANSQRDLSSVLDAVAAALTGLVPIDAFAAEALGVPPSTLESCIRRLGIDRLAFRRRSSPVGR